MSFAKLSVGSLVGGILFFFLGYLFYGVLFASFLETVSTPQAAGIMRPMEQMKWSGLIAGNLFSGIFISYIFLKSNVSAAGKGLWVGLVVGFLLGCSIDFTIYGTSHLFRLRGIAADVGISTLMMGITGAVVAPVMAKVGK